MHGWRRPEVHRWIDIVHAQPAGAGIGIGNARLHADPVAHLEMGHAGPDLCHRAGGLVPQHHGGIDHEGADLAMGVIVHVRTADPHGMDGDLDHARSDIKRQIDIAQGQLVLAFKDEGADLGHAGIPGIGERVAGQSPSGRAFLTHGRGDDYAPGGCIAPVMIATASDIE
jgi:hypothetical protein